MNLDPLRSRLPPAPAGSAPADPQAQKLLTRMTQLDGDLGTIEKQVLTWARTPLNRSAPLADLEDRIRSHEVSEQREAWDKKGRRLRKQRSHTSRSFHSRLPSPWKRHSPQLWFSPIWGGPQILGASCG